MPNVLIEAWDDYSPQELTFDIRSLCIKANRLCHMAEQDMVLQHNDLTKQRKENNEKYEVTLSIVVLDEFTPLMSRVTRCEGPLNIIEKELALAFSLNDRYKKSDDCIKIIGNTLDSICEKLGVQAKVGVTQPPMPKTLKEVPSFLLCTIPWYWIRRIWYSRHVRQFALILMLCSWALSIGLMLFLAKDNADLYKNMNMFEKHSCFSR